MKRRLRVGVLLGGRSVEHSVSLQSARFVLEVLRENRHEAVPIGITPEGKWVPLRALPSPETRVLTADIPAAEGSEAIARQLIGLGCEEPAGKKPAPPLDVVFPVLHGIHGEDGTLQGLLEMANIPYVGSGVLGSALGMDKVVMKLLFRQAQLPVTEFLVIQEKDWPRQAGEIGSRVERELGLPCFVKPSCSGSSIGISKVKSIGDLPAAVAEAFRYDRKVLVERAVPAREIECGILGNDDPIASVPGEVIPCREFYDYRAKYLEAGSELKIPAVLEEDQAEEIRKLAVKAFQALECSGMARVDFLLDRNTGRILVNELNTIPGFTAISMYPKLWEASGVNRNELLDRLLDLALERHRQKEEKETRFTPDGNAGRSGR